jgi:hypothetical protein
MRARELGQSPYMYALASWAGGKPFRFYTLFPAPIGAAHKRLRPHVVAKHKAEFERR